MKDLLFIKLKQYSVKLALVINKALNQLLNHGILVFKVQKMSEIICNILAIVSNVEIVVK